MIHTARQSPKFMRLVRRLRPLVGESSIIDTDAVATAVLERLWHATTTGAMRGDIGRFDDDVIAEMCGWLGDAGELIAILVETEWLDEHADPAVRLLVHDWSTHAPKHVKGNVTRKGGFIDPSPIGPAPKAPPQGTSPSDTPQGTGAPNLTQPNPTKPKKSSRAGRFVFTPVDRELAEWFWSLVLKLQPNRKPPNLDAWANDVRLIREVDGRPPPEIRSLCEWVHRDEFWQTNILSPAKLRAKWDDLQLRKSRGGNRSKIGAGQQYDPNAELVW